MVLLDSISLSHPDKLIRKEPDNFLDQLNNRISSTFPRILLTHVPLFRNPATQTCGPHREKRKPFPLQRGDQYQTVIEYEISRRILNTIKPTLIFAGDDHDYCDITQEYDGGAAREITVKSAAMTGGIKHPAVQLLSLNTNEPTKRMRRNCAICQMHTTTYTPISHSYYSPRFSSIDLLCYSTSSGPCLY